MKDLRGSIVAAALGGLLLAGSVCADTVDVLVGDKDGFGFTPACPNIGSCPGLSVPIIDNRSAAEMAATNGAQITDSYSALFGNFSPPGTGLTADVLLPFTGSLISGTLSFGAGDFQSNDFGALIANINGIPVSFSFPDGRFVTAIHSLTLNAAQLAAANSAGRVILHIERGGSGDFVAFDWFQLNGETSSVPVPEPTLLILLSGGLFGLGLMRGVRARKK
jgi:hypothetical protein